MTSMQPHKEQLCEACGSPLTRWNIAADCILLKCPGCFHIKRDLALCNAHARAHAWGGSAFFDKIRNILTIRRLGKALPRQEGLNVLEIGFGSGELLAGFLRQGHRVHGIEAEFLDIHIDEFLKKNATLYFGKAENIPLEQDQFDLIFGIHLVEHLDDPLRVFENCHSALRKGGLLYFITPNASSKGLSFFKDNWWNLEDPTHLRFFSPESIGVMLQKAGFRDIQTRTLLWDSMTVEINSLLRFFNQRSKKHGILEGQFTQLFDAALLPLAMAVRAVVPGLASSLEIMARKRE